MAGDEVVAGFADDADCGGGYQDQYWGVSVAASDTQVVQATAVAQGEFAELVDEVGTEPDGGAGAAEMAPASARIDVKLFMREKSGVIA